MDFWSFSGEYWEGVRNRKSTGTEGEKQHMNMRIINDISNFIFVEDSLEKADAILIPGGSYPELPEKAAELWKTGWADLIVPSGKYSVKLGKFAGVKSKKDIYNKDYQTEAEFQEDVLLINGVDKDIILLEAESECTADNARFTRKLLEEKNIQFIRKVSDSEQTFRAVLNKT